MNEESLFHEALAKANLQERAAFLDTACAGQPELRAAVEALLAASEQPDSFLNRPAVAVPAATIECPPISEGVGARIGPYKLLQQIGEGGMGIVWMAEQLEPVRRMVALKVIKPGMDSSQVVARFEAERQALALMDHPNIAKVFDAGTTENGRPYFVMELVKGVTITKYCDEHQLTPRERMELFVPVCQAIQHAHQKGIIHRDLKPSNVMIASYDGRPVPKVIDFGVAKAMGQQLTERTMFTGFGGIVGTLEYMSPEQAEFNALDVDTRSDIYSLGVLLYELLTGSTPLTKQQLQQAAITEVLRIIREQEPPKPSTRLSDSRDSLPALSMQRKLDPAKLTREVSGELDWIVMKALEKDRTRRYETANGLARDIERYLRDEAVEACPPSLAYRLRKFTRRNRRNVVVFTVVTALLLIIVVNHIGGYFRLQQAHDRAEAEAHRARIAANEAMAAEKQARVEAHRADAESTLARRRLYFAHMNLAQTAWQETRVGRVWELLDLHQPKPGEEDLRGFEWYYWDRVSHPYLLAPKGHTDQVHSVAFSPDGKRMATGSSDTTVRVWDAATGENLFTLTGHASGVTSVSFSPDGQRLASTSWDHTAKVWDLATRKELLTLTGHTAQVLCVAFSPNGERLATSSTDGTVKVWDAATGQESFALMKGPEFTTSDQILSVAFSPDGKRLAAPTNGGKTFKVWDAATGAELLVLTGHTNRVMSVAFSPDGKWIASGSYDQTLKVWDAATAKELLTLKGHTDGVYSVAFSPDSKRLASGSYDQTIKVWGQGYNGWDTGGEHFTLKGHTHYVMGVAFSPDGQRLASASWDGTFKVWDSTKREDTLSVHSPSMAFGPDSEHLATTKSVWNTITDRESVALQGQDGIVHCVAYSRDGKHLASASWSGLSEGGGHRPIGTIRLWDAKTGEERHACQGVGREIMGLVFSPDGKWLASAGWDLNVKVWDVATGKELRTLNGHTAHVLSVAFSPDGQRLASASEDQTVKIWNAATGDVLLTLSGHTGGVTSVAFSSDGKRLASASGDQTIKVWDALTGRESLTLKGHVAVVTGVAFSPDGQRLASSSRDQTVKIWDAVTGQEALTLKGHPGDALILNVAFSPDGNRLAAGFDFGRVKLWDARSMTLR